VVGSTCQRTEGSKSSLLCDSYSYYTCYGVSVNGELTWTEAKTGTQARALDLYHLSSCASSSSPKIRLFSGKERRGEKKRIKMYLYILIQPNKCSIHSALLRMRRFPISSSFCSDFQYRTHLEL
jgi:hypothetical protein